MQRDTPSSVILAALSEGRGFLYEIEAKKILADYGLPVAKSIIGKTRDEVASIANGIGFPVVLKIVSPQVLHKSDAGGVLVNLKNEEEVRRGYDQIIENVRSRSPGAEIVGVLVQEMVPSSTEVIVGGVKDPQFGPVVMFGVGGILTEIIKDVSFRVAPFDKGVALEMIDDIRSRQILHGARGMPKADLDALAGIVAKVSEVMFLHPEISTLDVNPVFAYEKGAKIVDARIILEETKTAAQSQRTSGADLNSILEPLSIAIIGASANPEKIGHKILKNIVDGGFRGRVYPVNPGGGEILGLKAYPSVLEVPGDVDTVIVVVPAKFVPSVIEECVKKGVKGAVIISSGFKDVGAEGAALERQILDVAAKGGLRIIGPNCQGVSVPGIGFYATWPLVKDTGNIGVISQSGTIALEIPSYLSKRALGYSKTIALGNKSDVDEADLISEMDDDESTKVITVYTEGVRDGRKLMDALKRASMRKPVFILKGGTTEAGKRAVLAHTGSLAGGVKVFEAAVRQSGGLCVRNLQELYDAAVVCSTSPLPKGNRVQIITSSGGSGILAVDASGAASLSLAKLSDGTIKRLKEKLPEWCVVGNPLDLTGNALSYVHLYREALEIVMEDPEVNMVLAIFGDPIPGACETISATVREASSRGIPVVVSYLGGADVQEVETDKLQKNGIAVFSTPERAIAALGYLSKYSKFRSRGKNNMLKM